MGLKESNQNAGLAFLQYQQIASINWNKLEGTIRALANAATSTINDNSSVAALVVSNFVCLLDLLSVL
jgi:hypothetical protein